MKNTCARTILILALAVGLCFFALLPHPARGDEPAGALIPFEAGDTLEQIREKIKLNGYQFTVKENWLTKLTPEQRSRMFRRRLPAQPDLARSARGMGPLARLLDQPQDLPSAFDWRDVNGHSYIGPIRNQGDCGSCYAFAAAATAEGAYNLAMGRVDGNTVDFSEAFIAWCLGSLSQYDQFYGCGGSEYDLQELDAIVAHGITLEPTFPYTDSDPQSCGTHDEAPRIRGFSEWHRTPCDVNDAEKITAIKTAIMNFGVVDVAVWVGDVDSPFALYSGGIYEDDKIDCPGQPGFPQCYYTPTDHLVSLVGWNDNEGYWILRNSWGPFWGEDGYMKIKYTSARVACEGSYLVYQKTGSNTFMQLLMPGL